MSQTVNYYLYSYSIFILLFSCQYSGSYWWTLGSSKFHATVPYYLNLLRMPVIKFTKYNRSSRSYVLRKTFIAHIARTASDAQNPKQSSCVPRHLILGKITSTLMSLHIHTDYSISHNSLPPCTDWCLMGLSPLLYGAIPYCPFIMDSTYGISHGHSLCSESVDTIKFACLIKRLIVLLS